MEASQGQVDSSDQQQSQQLTLTGIINEAGAPATTTQLEQALAIDDDFDVDNDHDFNNQGKFDFDEEADAFFNDLPPIITDQQDRLAQSAAPAEQVEPQTEEQNKNQKREKLQLTRADLKRRDVPLFDCIFCVQNAKFVIASVLKQSLVSKYLEACRDIAGSEQIPVIFSRKETMNKYDPDRVQDYFDSAKKSDDKEEANDNKSSSSTVTKEFLASSLWLCKQKYLPSRQEKVREHQYGQMPITFKRKVLVPVIVAQNTAQMTQLKRRSQVVFLKRAMYANNQKATSEAENAGTDQQTKEKEDASAKPLALDEIEDEVFVGKVALSNWAMTRAQRIIRDISFESKQHDIFNPSFSSDGAETDDERNEDQEDLNRIEDEEADGKICDERLSEINPCDNLANSSFESSHSESSVDTQLERCQPELHDSGNLHDDEIRESPVPKQKLAKHETDLNLQSQLKPTQIDEMLNQESQDPMATPQLSDISSFNSNDPQVRTIEISSSNSESGAAQAKSKSASKSVPEAKQRNQPGQEESKNVDKEKNEIKKGKQTEDDEMDTSSELSVANEVDEQVDLSHQKNKDTLASNLHQAKNQNQSQQMKTEDEKSTFSYPQSRPASIIGIDSSHLDSFSTPFAVNSQQNQAQITNAKLPKKLDFSLFTIGSKPNTNKLSLAYKSGLETGDPSMPVRSSLHTLMTKLSQQSEKPAIRKPGKTQTSFVGLQTSNSVIESHGKTGRQRSNRSVIVSQSSLDSQQMKNPFRTFNVRNKHTKYNTSTPSNRRQIEESKSMFKAKSTPNSLVVPSKDQNQITGKLDIAQSTKILGKADQSLQLGMFGPKGNFNKHIMSNMPSLTKQEQMTPTPHHASPTQRDALEKGEMTFSQHPHAIKVQLFANYQQNQLSSPSRNQTGHSEILNGHRDESGIITQHAINPKLRRPQSQHRISQTGDKQSPGSKTLIQVIHPTPSMKKVQPVGRSAHEYALTSGSESPLKQRRIADQKDALGRRKTNVYPSRLQADQLAQIGIESKLLNASTQRRMTDDFKNLKQQTRRQGQARSVSRQNFDFNERNSLRMQQNSMFSTEMEAGKHAPRQIIADHHQYTTKVYESKTSQRSREDQVIETDANYRTANAYQNRIQLKLKTEQIHQKSFLQNVHENSRRVRDELLSERMLHKDPASKRDSLIEAREKNQFALPVALSAMRTMQKKQPDQLANDISQQQQSLFSARPGSSRIFSGASYDISKFRSQSSNRQIDKELMQKQLTPRLMLGSRATPLSLAQQQFSSAGYRSVFENQQSRKSSLILKAQRPTVSNFQGSAMMQKRQSSSHKLTSIADQQQQKRQGRNIFNQKYKTETLTPHATAGPSLSKPIQSMFAPMQKASYKVRQNDPLRQIRAQSMHKRQMRQQKTLEQDERAGKINSDVFGPRDKLQLQRSKQTLRSNRSPPALLPSTKGSLSFVALMKKSLRGQDPIDGQNQNLKQILTHRESSRRQLMAVDQPELISQDRKQELKAFSAGKGYERAEMPSATKMPVSVYIEQTNRENYQSKEKGQPASEDILSVTAQEESKAQISPAKRLVVMNDKRLNFYNTQERDCS